MVEDAHIDGLVHDSSISSASAMEILQSCNKPLIYLLCVLPWWLMTWWHKNGRTSHYHWSNPDGYGHHWPVITSLTTTKNVGIFLGMHYWKPGVVMVTSSNGNIFRVTGNLCGEFTCPRWIPGQWHGALMFSLICVWINGWENNRGAGDLRRYRAHYDVIVRYGNGLLKELSWCKLCHYLWHCILFWQPVVPPVKANLVSWRLSVLVTIAIGHLS